MFLWYVEMYFKVHTGGSLLTILLIVSSNDSVSLLCNRLAFQTYRFCFKLSSLFHNYMYKALNVHKNVHYDHYE